MSRSEALKTVNALNEHLWEENKTESHFWLETDGCVERILYDNLELWYSESDEREYLEETNEYEPLLPHVQKLFNEMVDSLQLLKFKKKRKKK